MASKTDPIAKSQEQLFDMYKQSQEVFLAGVEAWTRAARDMTDAATSMVDVAAFDAAIDQTFAGATKALEQQRDFLKKLHATAYEATHPSEEA